MLRAQVSLVYLVLVGLFVALAAALIHFELEDAFAANASASVQHTVVGAERSAHLEEASLVARAAFVGNNDRLYRSLKGEFIAEKEAEGAEGEKEGEEAADGEDKGTPEYRRHLDAHEKLSARKYHLDELAKAEADVPPEARSLLARAPREIDIFVVLDEKGEGVAALGKDLYSWFGASHGESYPEIAEVAKGGTARAGYWMWSFKPGDEKRLYRVGIAPVRRSPDEKPSGVVVLGSMVNDGLAKREQEAFTGASAETDAASSIHVAYYRGETIVGSTFASAQQTSIAAALASGGLMGAEPSATTEVSVGEASYIAASRPLAAGEKTVGVAVLTNLADAQTPIGALRMDVLLVGVLFLLIGASLLVAIIHRYIKPVEDLEDGIQEVIAGNKDYVWAQLKGNDLQSALAQQLNLMSAFLQGKPMPDDDQAGQGWGDLISGGADTSNEGPGQVQGVDLAGLMGARPPSDSGDA